MKKLLQIKNLSVSFHRFDEQKTVVSNLSLEISCGEKLALVGESGSGKSVTALSIMQLLDRRTTAYQGSILFEGKDLLQSTEKELMALRGNDIAMVFQEPMTALNPLRTVGSQIMENILVHRTLDKATAKEETIRLIEQVGIDQAQRRFDSFPHMLSGGQRQRILIAMALSCSPKLLIADEPTTALDVTIKKQIIDLLEQLQQKLGIAILMITHDLNMVKQFADRVMVMQYGKIVEQNTTGKLFHQPRDPYTIKLLASLPKRMVQPLSQKPPLLLEAREIQKRFLIKKAWLAKNRGYLYAVNQINLSLHRGETLGIVGESGSGKSTLGRCLLRLYSCQGRIFFHQQEISKLGQKQLRPVRKQMQIVFQDPYSSLSPRMTIEQILMEGLNIHFGKLSHQQKHDKMMQALKDVELEQDTLYRYPHEFSGGQRQRIAIARSIVLEPDLILLDEPTSALDVSIQQQILQLLLDLQQKYHLSYIIISHDLAVIHALSHRVMVMKDGRIIEQNEAEALFARPQHSYTQQLLSASGLSL